MILDILINPKLVINLTSNYFSKKFNYNFRSCNFSIIEDDWFGYKYILMIRHYEHVFSNNLRNNHITINKFLVLDEKFSIVDMKIFEPNINHNNNTITGIEDIRLIKYKNDLYYYGNTKIGILEHSNTPSSLPIKIGVQLNKFNLDSDNLVGNSIINPNHIEQQDIEKNWSHINLFGKSFFIYGWYPFIVSELNFDKKTLDKIKELNIDKFKDLRGSTNGLIIDNEIWVLTHKTSENRDYLHKFVILDLDLNPIRFSNYFKFNFYKIEFCLSMIKKDDNILICYSGDDKISLLKEYNIKNLKNTLNWFNI